MATPTVVLVSTAPQTLRIFLGRQIEGLTAAGFSIHAVSSPGIHLEALHRETGIGISAVPMKRAISPLSDCLAIFRLWRILSRIRPEIVQTHTPKAGLIAIVSATFALIPVRIYTVNGLVWESTNGFRRSLLISADRIAAAMATTVLCVSHSVRQQVLNARLCGASKARVLGNGGSHGVDTERFSPALHSRSSSREELGIRSGGLVFGFVGRFVPDKGFGSLVLSWAKVRTVLSGATLLLVGEREQSHPIDQSAWEAVTSDPSLVVTSAEPARMPAVYAAMDVLLLPTRREGLPNVVLEASAMGVPVIATRVTGCVDAVRNEVTGLLIDPDSSEALTAAMLRLANDSELRLRLGRGGRKFVSQEFSEQAVTSRLIHEYRELLNLPGPDKENPKCTQG